MTGLVRAVLGFPQLPDHPFHRGTETLLTKRKAGHNWLKKANLIVSFVSHRDGEPIKDAPAGALNHSLRQHWTFVDRCRTHLGDAAQTDGVGFSFPNVGIYPTALHTNNHSVIDTSVMPAIPLRPPSQLTRTTARGSIERS